MYIDYNIYNNPIIDIYINNTEDILELKTSLYTYQYKAIGDCCSFSKFKTYQKKSFSFLKGKIIKTIKEINIPQNINIYELDNDYLDEEDFLITPHLFEFSFKNSNDTFKFLMINYSNGYYDGWITSSLINNNN